MSVAKVPSAVINAKGRRRLATGHLWIYRSDVCSIEAAPGEVVTVRDRRGRFLGQAFYSDRSAICLRLVTRMERPVDEEFWRERLVTALRLRQSLYPGQTLYRWVYGESDGIPSLILDRYGDYVVIQTLSQGTERLKQTWVRLVSEILKPRGILERNDPKVRSLEGLPPLVGCLQGEVPEEVVVREGELELRVNLWRGQKTGLFLDQRENRRAAARYAEGRGLDLFCYEGGFALQMAAGGCEEVIAVDSSGAALARLRANAAANGLERIEAVEANVFDLLRELAGGGERFDTIVLDPPAFAKNRAAVERARRGYKEINLRAMKLLRPGGHLITSSCSYHLSESGLLEILDEAAADTGTRLVLVERRLQARDHPILLAMPETHYLKCLILRKGLP